MLRRFALLLAFVAALVQPFGLGGARLQSWVEHAMVHASAADHHHHDADELSVHDGGTSEGVFHLHPDAGAASAPPSAPRPALGQPPAQPAPVWVASGVPSPDLARLLRPPQDLS